MAIFGYDREEVERRTGHWSQMGGLKPHTLSDGRAAGVRAVDFRTTRGLEFTVLLDRCMDISEARYKGMSLCWRSCAGDAAPAFYDARGQEWLWTFFGGLLTTCGLTQIGPPNADEGEELGLHGRIATAPAEKVNLYEDWSEGRPLLEASGTLREARLFGPHLEMRRTVQAFGDSARLGVRDRIVNAGARPAPLMLLYHINVGFPLLDDGAELILPTAKVEGRDDLAKSEGNKWSELHGPVAGYEERVYFHTMKADAEGLVTCAVVNRKLGDGLGLRLRYRLSELPHFTQWKMLGEREYVLGIEPGNSPVVGRSAARSAGRLVELKVNEEVTAGFEIEVVEGADEVDALAAEVARI
jgi:hypothetical protein